MTDEELKKAAELGRKSATGIRGGNPGVAIAANRTKDTAVRIAARDAAIAARPIAGDWATPLAKTGTRNILAGAGKGLATAAGSKLAGAAGDLLFPSEAGADSELTPERSRQRFTPPGVITQPPDNPAAVVPGGPAMLPSHGPNVTQAAIPPAPALTVKKVGDGYIVKKADGSVHLTNKPLEYGTQAEIDAGLQSGKGNKTWFSGPAGGNPTATNTAIPDYRGDYAQQVALDTAKETGPKPAAIPGERDSSRDKTLSRESESDYVKRRSTQDIAAWQGQLDRMTGDKELAQKQLLQEAETRKATIHTAVQENLYQQAIKNKDNDMLLMLAGLSGKTAIPKREEWKPFTDETTSPDGMTTTKRSRFFRGGEGKPEIYDPNATTGATVDPAKVAQVQKYLAENPDAANDPEVKKLMAEYGI